MCGRSPTWREREEQRAEDSDLVDDRVQGPPADVEGDEHVELGENPFEHL